MLKKAIAIVALFAALYLIPNYMNHRENSNISIGISNTEAVNLTPTLTLNQTTALNSDKITLSFVGDILLAGNIENRIRTHGKDSIFMGVKDILSSSNVTVGNLESSVSMRGVPQQNKTYTFRAKPERLQLLKDSGFDVVSIANNHILDYGTNALYDTMSYLDKYKILHGGAGKNRHDACKPVVVKVNNKKIAFLFYSYVIPSNSWVAGGKSPGVASAYNHTDLLNTIQYIRKSVDVVAVYIHWGKERAMSPEEYQRNLAYSAIDKGADMVIGTHTHTLQGFEVYKDKLIAYSLGNFVFNSSAKSTMIVNVDIEKGKPNRYYYIPCISQNYSPVVVTDSGAKSKMDMALEQRSFDVKINDNTIQSNQD